MLSIVNLSVGLSRQTLHRRHNIAVVLLKILRQQPSIVQLSRGNPTVMPCKSHNFDISLDKFFNRGKGVFSVAYFDKIIKHDIYTTRSTEVINDELTYVTQPRNANNSSLMGVEVSIVNRNIKGPWKQSFDINASGAWTDITDDLRLKYEVYNLAGSHTRMYYGQHLDRLEEKEDYGRSIYFELVYN